MIIDIPNVEEVSLPYSFEKLQNKSISSTINILNSHNILDIGFELFKMLPYTLFDIESLDSNITSLILPNWSCNDVNYTIFDISRFTLLESLEIGDDSFGSIESFLINDLPKLRNLKIGSNSFTLIKAVDWNSDAKRALEAARNESKSFHILNCESLESIEIGVFSFLDFGGGFELSNLKSLKSIKIGSFKMDSRNYIWSSFIIRGMLYHYILYINE